LNLGELVVKQLTKILVLLSFVFLINAKVQANWEYSYYPNGQIRAQVYIDYYGKPEGALTHFFENGQKSMEQYFSNGKMHGSITHWYSPGFNKKSQMHYVNDELDGTYRVWGESGEVILSGYYKDGLREGIWEIYNYNTYRIDTICYENDKEVNTSDCNNGNNSPSVFADGGATAIDGCPLAQDGWHHCPSGKKYKPLEGIGKVVESGSAKAGYIDANGNHQGRFITHLADGRVYEGNYKNGVPNGYGKMTWSDGDVYEGNWKNNYQDGYGKMTWSDGDVYEGNWENGNMSDKLITRNLEFDSVQVDRF